jgi:hypothetical protein
MAATILATGVLGLAGYGIWRRSQLLGGEADALPLPRDLEVKKSRKYVLDTVTAEIKPGGLLPGMTDLAGFFDATGWATGNIQQFDPELTATLNGDIWFYTRLVQASSLQMMALINEAQNSGSEGIQPPLRPSQVGSHLSVFNLKGTEPINKKEPAGLAADIKRIELYLRQKIPVPNSDPAPPSTTRR